MRNIITMPIPNTYTDINETGCCAVPNVEEWDQKEFTFENKRFIRMHTRSFFYIPLNMSKIMRTIQEVAKSADATMPPREVMILSRDISPWKAEQIFSVTKEILGADNVMLLGTYISKVFEGPYKNVGKWAKELLEYTEDVRKTAKKTYFFYTTCPKCSKYYGKNYVIGLVEVQ